jgi:flagellar biosynthesis/type III secretory pathway protein FliH
MRGWAKRKLKDIWYRGYAAGYQEGHTDGVNCFTDRVIHELVNDAVISMTADIDTIERVVEIIEAVHHIGKTPS